MSLWGPRDEKAEAEVRRLLDSLADAPVAPLTEEEIARLREQIEERTRPYRTRVTADTLFTVLD